MSSLFLRLLKVKAPISSRFLAKTKGRLEKGPLRPSSFFYFCRVFIKGEYILFNKEIVS